MYKVIVDAFAGSRLQNELAVHTGVLGEGVKLCQFERYQMVLARRPTGFELSDIMDTFKASFDRDGRDCYFLSARAEDTLGNAPDAWLSYTTKVHTISDGARQLPFAQALRTIGYDVKTDLLQRVVTVTRSKKHA